MFDETIQPDNLQSISEENPFINSDPIEYSRYLQFLKLFTRNPEIERGKSTVFYISNQVPRDFQLKVERCRFISDRDKRKTIIGNKVYTLVGYDFIYTEDRLRFGYEYYEYVTTDGVKAIGGLIMNFSDTRVQRYNWFSSTLKESTRETRIYKYGDPSSLKKPSTKRIS